MIELKPLPGFNVTWPAAINDLGRVVGSSSDPVQSGGPHSLATLWSSGPVHLGGPPSIYPLSTSGNNSESLAINNKGEVLYYEYEALDQPSTWTSFLWANGASVDLNTLGLTLAVDLNDEGLILGCSGEASHPLVVYDRGANTVRALPPITVNGEAKPTYLNGLDNAGRVLAAIRTPVGYPETPISPDYYIGDHFYLEVGDATWKPTHISITAPASARLTRHGWVLGTVPDAQGNNVACYLDLNDPAAGLSFIPRLGSGGGSYSAVATDANAQGRIVGHEGWNTPICYDTASDELSEVALGQGWTGHYARGINASGKVIGFGSAPSGHNRGWVVEAA
jgi:uncharacterized membrane protein